MTDDWDGGTKEPTAESDEPASTTELLHDANGNVIGSRSGPDEDWTTVGAPTDQIITDPDAPEVADALNAALGGSDVEPVVPLFTPEDAARDRALVEEWSATRPVIDDESAPPAGVAGEKPYIHHG